MEASNAIFTGDFVTDLLPQKSPFVMMDSLFHYSETSLTAGMRVETLNIFYHNGFLTEGGLIEHMAQAAALHTGYKFFLMKLPPPIGYLGSIKDIRIRRLPKLYEEIRTTINILQEFGGISLVDVTSRVDSIEIANGQMKTIVAK